MLLWAFLPAETVSLRPRSPCGDWVVVGGGRYSHQAGGGDEGQVGLSCILEGQGR